MTWQRSPDAVVVGAGVIGCAIAYELAKRGVKVLVLEKDLAGSGATYASAGMLAPLSDNLEAAPLQDLGSRAFRMYPRFLQEIEEEAGMTVECLPSGIIRTAFTEQEAGELRDIAGPARELGLPLHYLSGDEARKLEPLIGPGVLAATYSPGEPHVSAGRLVETLRRAAVSQGAEFREQTPVTGLARDGHMVTSVVTPQERINAGAVIIAMGSWSCVAGPWLGLDLPITPVRGQMLYVNKPARPLRHTVMHHLAYAAPKGDGTTLLGTTLEHAGFDARVTLGGISSVLAGIQRLLPSFSETTVNHTRAGLRPMSEDHLPYIGIAPGADNVLIATGHYRSGILLTPVTADLIAKAFVDGPKSVDFGPHNASRLKKVS